MLHSDFSFTSSLQTSFVVHHGGQHYKIYGQETKQEMCTMQNVPVGTKSISGETSFSYLFNSKLKKRNFIDLSSIRMWGAKWRTQEHSGNFYLHVLYWTAVLSKGELFQHFLISEQPGLWQDKHYKPKNVASSSKNLYLFIYLFIYL